MSKVSIIIPTRNRAHLLGYAIRSALNQTYQNIEVVICDNASLDDTSKVANLFLSDSRVKYVRTNDPLSMPDNWDYALKHAGGDFITYLTDDSVLFSNSIEYVMNELLQTGSSVAVWRHAAYYYPDWVERSRQNVLYIPHSTNTTKVISSADMVRRLYGMDSRVWTDIPKSLNSICHRNIVESVLCKQGRFFPPSCPDYSSAAGVLLNTNSYLLIDRVLYIDAVTNSSIGATTSYNLGEASRRFISEFSEGLSELMSMGVPVAPSGIAKSIENVARAYPETNLKVNTENLVAQVADRVAKVESNGGDVSIYWQALGSYTSNNPMLDKVWRRSRRVSRVKWWMVNVARRSQAIAFLERVRGFDVYKGDKAQFNNIEEAANFAKNFI